METEVGDLFMSCTTYLAFYLFYARISLQNLLYSKPSVSPRPTLASQDASLEILLSLLPLLFLMRRSRCHRYKG